jgi:hypothetical protein
MTEVTRKKKKEKEEKEKERRKRDCDGCLAGGAALNVHMLEQHEHISRLKEGHGKC